jgi:dimethylaniline monooxygenase (N-oxide forming)
MEAQGMGKRLCVIGAGAIGLVTTKNFLEQGFDVTTYERNDYVGGLWHATDDLNQTSVLEGTRANLSKHGVSNLLNLLVLY